MEKPEELKYVERGIPEITPMEIRSIPERAILVVEMEGPR